jgi:flagellar biosynthesis protein FlhF
MRLRSFEARSMAEAMQEVRRLLGEQAVIVATHEAGDRVRVTAACEVAEDDLEALLTPSMPPSVPGTVERCLVHHAAPSSLRGALLAELARAHAGDAATGLARALEARFRFAPLALPSPRPLALVGPPGAGKTTSLVRLAAQALVAGHPVRILSTDTVRAGGLAQLRQLLEALRLEPTAVAGSDELVRLVAGSAPATSILIDTTGINPFQAGELTGLAELLRAGGAEPVLVLPAGIDAEDSVEIASNFATIGAGRMIVTKLDAARRLGGVLAAADAGLALAGAGIAPTIGRSVPSLHAAGLARVLLHRAGGAKPDGSEDGDGTISNPG